MGKLAMLGGLIGVRLPEKLQTLIYRNRDTYRGETIDVQALALGHLANTVRIPGHLPTVAESREQSEKTGTMFDRKAPPLARIEDFEINGADGPIAARLYSDTVDKSQLQPAVIYAHGGGFVQGSLDSHHAVCAKLAKWSGGIVVAVDYRLAPEYPFPHGVNDFMAAFKSLAENGTSLGIDVNRMGVAGDSAGACLAAVASAELSGSPVAPKFQVLIYPVTDGHLNSQSV
ncbi:MAG TPA: hypothetical protein ENJ55_07620, partial [Rhizobiales bacterium]|nr:hypothetical protein [Hyphomicrobiales bacterium]